MKFRSWIPSIKTFTYFENGVYSCPKVQFDKVPFDWGNAEQFSGICDKSSLNIYEGDIVLLDDCGDSLYEVVFNDSTLCYEVHNLNPKTGEWESETLIDFESLLEVIGNIHESPELLSTY